MDPMEKFEGWAIVELMGKVTMAGYVSEHVIAGAGMLRVDVPAVGDGAAYSKYVAPGALYGMTPTTEAIARTLADRLRVVPVAAWMIEPRNRPLVDTLGGDWHDGDSGSEQDF